MDKENLPNTIPVCFEQNFVQIPCVQLKPLHLSKTSSIGWSLDQEAEPTDDIEEEINLKRSEPNCRHQKKSIMQFLSCKQ